MDPVAKQKILAETFKKERKCFKLKEDFQFNPYKSLTSQNNSNKIS